MRDLLVLVLIVASLAVVCTATYKDGQPCSPSERKPCGPKTVTSQPNYYPCTHCTGRNVCKKVTEYTKHYYQYVYKKKCYKKFWFGRYCKYYCTQTDSCSYVKKYSKNEYTCCQGYTTAPSPTDYHYSRYGNSIYYLKRNGCPRAIVNTTLQCLIDLGLSEVRDLLISQNIEALLNGDTGGEKITVFAPTNRAILASNLDSLTLDDLEIVLGSHVVRKTVPAVKLYDGQSLPTVLPKRFIQVREIELKKWKTYTYHYYERIFINGQELTIRDACVATNGIVHVIDGIIDSSNKTIAQVVQYSSNLTDLYSLLNAADLINFLSNPTPLLTLFAPTDEALNAASSDLGVDIVRCLLSNKQALKKFLLYHVTCGAEYSSSLVLQKKLVTKSCKKKKYSFYHYGYWRYKNKYYTVCKKLSVDMLDNGIGVGGAGSVITHLDVPANNGVVHYISLPLIHPWLDLAKLCDGFQIQSIVPPPPPLVPPPPSMY